MKRYNLDQGSDYHPAATMDENAQGDWVEADEALSRIAALEAELAEVKAEREAQRSRVLLCQFGYEPSGVRCVVCSTVTCAGRELVHLRAEKAERDAAFKRGWEAAKNASLSAVDKAEAACLVEQCWTDDLMWRGVAMDAVRAIEPTEEVKP